MHVKLICCISYSRPNENENKIKILNLIQVSYSKHLEDKNAIISHFKYNSLAHD